MSDDKQPYDGATIGEQIGGYRLLRRLGDGSTSTVFLGEHVRLGRHSAIKVLSSDFSEDAQTIQRLVNEARVVNDIRHPNIADISDIVEQEAPRRVALVMEYIKGPSLKTFRGNPLLPTQALALAIQLVDAVQAAHARGVIHRDIKPDNLLLAEDPALAGESPLELKVVDFGIAKLSGPESQSMTVSGTMLGTPAYMAPEQIVGSPRPSPATDVFAVGAVVYELITGLRAYPSTRVQDTVRAKLRGEIPELETLEIAGGARLLALIRTCLQRQPTARPGLDQVRATLDRCLRQAAGERLTDALALPTLGLTSAGPLPAPAATELSGVPEGAMAAVRKAQDEDKASRVTPALIAALHAQEPDDEDEVGTELAQASLGDPGGGQLAATEQASAELPHWMAGQKDVATAMAGPGISEHASGPTNQNWDALTDEVVDDSEPPRRALEFSGLLGPAGAAETAEASAQSVNESAATKPPPARASASSSARKAPLEYKLSSQDSLRPDQLFASGVGLGPTSLSPSSSRVGVPAPATGSSSVLFRGLLVVLVVLLVAACVVGAAFVGGMIDVEADAEPAPVHDAVPEPSVTPRN